MLTTIFLAVSSCWLGWAVMDLLGEVVTCRLRKRIRQAR